MTSPLALYRTHRTMILQFLRYLVGGGTAAATELISYRIMLFFGMWYLVATPLSSAIGITAAFLLHKYFVFKKKDKTASQALRYALLTVWNILAQMGIVYLLVDHLHAGPMIAKILGIGCVVSWNFFLYKFVVYA